MSTNTAGFTDAKQAFEWITGARWKGEKHGLENTRALLEALGAPDERMGRILHVAGTNGKGSTCAMLDKALRACGYKTGLFTSPYLCHFQERMRVNGCPISDDELIDAASRVREAADRLAQKEIYCTTFELWTATACLWFSEQNTDAAVMEVGMGGRLDPTNVLSPDISLIATIGMDHMGRLGDTLTEIAGEKAGIIKPNTPACVLTQTEDVMRVFRETARAMRAPLFETAKPGVIHMDARGATFSVELPSAGLQTQTIALSGAHQIGNACLALTALDVLRVDMKRAMDGVSKTIWPGRLEWIGNILIDGAHNPQGARALIEYAHAYMKDRRIILLTGMMQDKQLQLMSEILAPLAERVVCTQVNWPRAASAEALKALYGARAEAAADVETALARARALAGEDGCIIVAGSIYLAGDVRNLLLPADDGVI